MVPYRALRPPTLPHAKSNIWANFKAIRAMIREGEVWDFKGRRCGLCRNAKLGAVPPPLGPGNGGRLRRAGLTDTHVLFGIYPLRG